jgi:hypothetical protein
MVDASDSMTGVYEAATVTTSETRDDCVRLYDEDN